jgi:hypothetical protein
MPKEKLKELKNLNDDIKNDLHTLEHQLYSILDNTKDDIEFFDNLFKIQDEISKNSVFRENGISDEFYKLFKILIFLSSKIDTRDKEFRTKLFNILNDFKTAKQNMIDLSENYIDLFEKLIDLFEKQSKPKPQNTFFKNIIEISSKSKPVGIAISVILIFLFLYILKIADQSFYDDIKKTIIKPTTEKIIKISKE